MEKQKHFKSRSKKIKDVFQAINYGRKLVLDLDQIVMTRVEIENASKLQSLKNLKDFKSKYILVTSEEKCECDK